VALALAGMLPTLLGLVSVVLASAPALPAVLALAPAFLVVLAPGLALGLLVVQALALALPEVRVVLVVRAVVPEAAASAVPTAAGLPRAAEWPTGPAPAAAAAWPTGRGWLLPAPQSPLALARARRAPGKPSGPPRQGASRPRRCLHGS